jgi:hypothetical protein
MAGSSELPDELRKQIEDALAQGRAERLPGAPQPKSRPVRPSTRLPDWRPRTPKDLLLIGVLAALVAWMLPIPFKQEVLVLGVVLGGVALLSMLVRPQGRQQRYWRGRPVELPAEGWTDRLYRLLYRG